MKDIQTAEKLLLSNACSCVLCCGDKIYSSKKSGIRPLIDFIDENINLAGFSAADKIVGKAAALMYAHLGVACVHAVVLSKAGADILSKYHISYSYDTLCEYIINRKGDGICPIEASVATIDEPIAALCAIKTTLNKLMKGTE